MGSGVALRGGQIGGGDPLEGINFTLRFHTNDGVTAIGESNVTRIAFAELSGANGDYWTEDSYVWTAPNGNQITGNDIGGTYEWVIQDRFGSVYYVGYGPEPYGIGYIDYNEETPSVLQATSEVGPIYAAKDVYQDEELTIPATDDGHVVMGWKDPISNKVLSWSNSLQCPILRFKFGYPVLEFGVGQRLYAVGDAQSAFSSKEKSQAWVGCQGTRVSTCLPLTVRTDDNAVHVYIYSRVGGRNYVYGRRLAADSLAAANVAAASDDWFVYGGKFDWINNSLIGVRNDVSSSPVTPSSEGGLTSATISPEIMLGSATTFTGSVSSFLVLDDILDDVAQNLVLSSLLSRQPS